MRNEKFNALAEECGTYISDEIVGAEVQFLLEKAIEETLILLEQTQISHKDKMVVYKLVNERFDMKQVCV